MRRLILLICFMHAFMANAEPDQGKPFAMPALGEPAKTVVQEELVIRGGEFDQYPILTDDSQFKNVDALVKQLEKRLAEGNVRPVSAVMLKNLLAYAQFVQQSRAATTKSLNNSVVSLPPKSFVVIPEAIAPVKVAAATNVPVIDGSIKASAYNANVTIYRKPGSLVLYNDSQKASDVSLINADYKPPTSTPTKPSPEEQSAIYHNKVGVMAANAAKYFPGGFKVWPPSPNTEVQFSPSGNRGIAVAITTKDSNGTSRTSKTTWYLSDIGWWSANPDKHVYPATQSVDPHIADQAYQTVLGMIPSIQGSNKEEGAEPFFHSAQYTVGKPEGKGTLGVNFFKWIANGKQTTRIQEFKVVYSPSLGIDIANTLASLQDASEGLAQGLKDRLSQFTNKAANVYEKGAAALKDNCSRWCLTKMSASIAGEIISEKHTLDPLIDRYAPARLVKYAIKGTMSADQISDAVDAADNCVQTRSCKG